MVLARRAELQAVQLATDVKSLIQWLNHDILALAGPPWAERQKLFDFIVEELSRRETLLAHSPSADSPEKSTGRLAGFRSSFR